MTPKKDIVRKPVHALPDGSPIPKMGKKFSQKEDAFIYWFTNTLEMLIFAKFR